MPITFKRAGQEAVTLENVSFKGVALDKVTFKRAGQEAVTVFENVTEDALAGTWVINESPDVSTDYNFNFNFTSDNRNFINFRITVKPRDANIMYNGTVEVFNTNNGWQNENYKTIAITSKLSEVTNGEQLLAWLQANATKQ